LGSIGVTIPNTLPECRKALQQYEKEFQATIREETQTKRFRLDHQKKLIQEYEQKGDKKEAAILRRIQRAEQVKKVFLKCKAARNLLREGGISYLMVPTDTTQDPKTCTDWTRVDCPDEIVALLQERNRSHFGQSRDCNLTSDPFDFTMDFTAACHRAEAMLE
jgi:hypothetical protein